MTELNESEKQLNDCCDQIIAVLTQTINGIELADVYEIEEVKGILERHIGSFLTQREAAAVAGAYLDAQKVASDCWHEGRGLGEETPDIFSEMLHRIGKRTPADAQAALAGIEAAAEHVGWKKGVAAGFLSAAVIVRDGKVDEQECYPPEADKVVEALAAHDRDIRQQERERLALELRKSADAFDEEEGFQNVATAFRNRAWAWETEHIPTVNECALPDTDEPRSAATGGEDGKEG